MELKNITQAFFLLFSTNTGQTNKENYHIFAFPNQIRELGEKTLMGRYFMLAIAILYSHFTIAQVNSASHKDTTQTQLYIQKGNSLRSTNPDSALLFFRQAMEAVSKSQPTIKAQIHQDMGTLFRSQSQFDSANHHFTEALTIYQTEKDSLGIAKSVNNIGTIHFFRGNYKQALGSYQKAIKLFEKVNFTKGIADCNNNIGIIHWKQKNYELAQEYYKKAGDAYQKLGNKQMQAYI